MLLFGCPAHGKSKEKRKGKKEKSWCLRALRLNNMAACYFSFFFCSVVANFF